MIRPYLARLTQPQLFAVMTVGMAGVAGTILAVYAGLLGPTALPFLLAASFMAAPGGLLMAKIVMPDVPAADEGELPLGDDIEEQVVKAVEHDIEEERAANVIMAASNGALTARQDRGRGGAMVLAFVSLVALANGLLGGLGQIVVQIAAQFGPDAGAWAQAWFGDLSFQKIVGAAFAPVMYLIGIPWADATSAAACSAPRWCSTNSSPSSISAR